MECGGLLFLCVNRNIFISGSINSDGTNAYNKNGGNSGGGNITIYYGGKIDNKDKITANGGNSSKNATTARTGRGGNGAINLIKI